MLSRASAHPGCRPLKANSRSIKLSEYRDFLELSYAELEDLNLAAKEQRKRRVAPEIIQAERLHDLTEGPHATKIKAVTVVFSDLEGRLHMLDYDKKFLVKSYDNLTFDGSSIRGFTAQRESDLRLALDWSAFYWTPADVFGAGKVLVFGEVIDKNGDHYAGDLRGVLKAFAKEMYETNGYTLNAANEIEGFLVRWDRCGGAASTRRSRSNTSTRAATITRCRAIRCVSSSIRRPKCSVRWASRMRRIIPRFAPSQFEINYTYGDVVAAADQIQLYKLICRQIATQMGMTASFLPKPVTGVNGSGMHTNVSITKNGKNLFWDPKGEEKISKLGWSFVDRILTHGNDLCLLLNASVNAYRRLDPHFEAPNQIKASATDRGSMVRIPIGNEKSARVEVRSVGPDANPYMVLYSVFKSGLHGDLARVKNLRQAERYLPDNIYTALDDFRNAEWTTTLLGEDVKSRYAELKQASADRCPRLLGTIVKPCEVQFHHDVYNQLLWGQF